MCTSCNCSCNKKLKLEAGKKYTDGFMVVQCLAVLPESPNWPYVCVSYPIRHPSSPFLIDINGDSSGSDTGVHGSPPKGLRRIVSEYKEPVVHSKDVVWVSSQSRVYPCLTDVGAKLKNLITGKEVHRQTVEYVEKQS